MSFFFPAFREKHGVRGRQSDADKSRITRSSLALTRRTARIGMGDGIDVFGVNGMPRSTDGGTWGKTSLTRWNPFMAIVVVVVEVLLGPTVGGIKSFPNC